MKYIIPTVALAITVTVIPTMDVAAANPNPTTVRPTSTQISRKSDAAIAARIATAKKDIAIIRAGLKTLRT